MFSRALFWRSRAAIGMLALPQPAKASDGGTKTLVQCLGAQVETEAYASCIGLIANRCLAGASDNENALNRLSGMAECYKREQAAWQTLISRAVAAWKQDNATPLVLAIEDAVASGRRFGAGQMRRVRRHAAVRLDRRWCSRQKCHCRRNSAHGNFSSATASTKEEGGRMGSLFLSKY